MRDWRFSYIKKEENISCCTPHSCTELHNGRGRHANANRERRMDQMIQFSYRHCQLVLQLQLQLQLRLRVLLECSLYSNTRCCPIYKPQYYPIVCGCVDVCRSVSMYVRVSVCVSVCVCFCRLEQSVTFALPVGPLCRRATFALGFSFHLMGLSLFCWLLSLY